MVTITANLQLIAFIVVSEGVFLCIHPYRTKVQVFKLFIDISVKHSCVTSSFVVEMKVEIIVVNLFL